MGEAESFLPTLPPSPGLETARALLVAMAVGEEAVVCFQKHLPLLGEPREMFGSRKSSGVSNARGLPEKVLDPL